MSSYNQRRMEGERSSLTASIERAQDNAFAMGRQEGVREATLTLATFRANANNDKLTDAEFRQFMRNCLQ